MRILANAKRDSVSGEEVVVVSVSSTASNNSESNNYSSSAPILFMDRASSTFPDLPGKLNRAEGSNKVISSSSISKNNSNLRKVNKPKKHGSKLERQRSKRGQHYLDANKSPCSWKNRAIGKSVTFVFSIFHSYCSCVSWEEEGGRSSSDNYRKGNKSEDNRNQLLQLHEKEIVGDGSDGGGGGGVRQKVEHNAVTVNGCSFGESTGNTISTAVEQSVINSTGNTSTESAESEQVGIDATEKSGPCKDQLTTYSGTANSKIMRSGIYHEKQVKSLCALHALNNLLQDGKAFKQEDLDKICSELDPNSWVNPHKSVFGLGNYDINVIMTALQQKKLETIWFDKRKDPSHELNFENIYGFILNIPSDCKLGWLALPIKRKHWVAIRNLPSITERDAGRSNYYNLDSKFDKPESIGSTENLIEYLRGELRSPEKELFLVVTEDIGRLETWRRNPPAIIAAAAAAASSSAEESSAGHHPSASGATHLLPLPTGDDASAGSGNFRRTSNDSGVVDLLPDLRDMNIVDLNKEDLMRRQSSGVWSDLT